MLQTALPTSAAAARRATRLFGCTLALLGWAHLTGPTGPDLRESLLGRGPRASQASLVSLDERLRRERRLRRELSNRGFRLIRRRCRGPAPPLGSYLVFDLTAGRIVAGEDPSPAASNLDAVEAWFAQSLAPDATTADTATGPRQAPAARLPDGDRPRSKMAPHRAALAAHLTAHPGATLAELRAWMLEKRGVAVSIATVCKTLQQLGLAPKHGRGGRGP